MSDEMVADGPVAVHVDDMPGEAGRTFGPSPWLLVGQPLISEFGRLTRDMMWYHTDPERAARELPDGKTFAHGLLTLSLVPGLLEKVLTIRFDTRMLNYGYDRLRFLAPVQVDDRIRLSVTVVEVAPHPRGRVLRFQLSVESEQLQQPVLAAEQLLFVLSE